MQVVPVDPRDQIAEVDEPRYRVYFWQNARFDQYEISGADVVEVLTWAQDHAASRPYSVWASIPAVGDEVVLIRLAGWEEGSPVARPAHAATLP